MNEIERKKWVDELKVGDQVAVRQRGFGDRSDWRVLTVEYITKTRARIDLGQSDGVQVQSVGKDGLFPRSSGGYYGRAYIEPITPQVLADIKWVRTRYLLSSLETKVSRKGRDSWTLEQMQRLIAAYKEALGDEAERQD